MQNSKCLRDIIVLSFFLLGMLQPTQHLWAAELKIMTGTLHQKWCLTSDSDDHIIGQIVDAVGDSQGNIYLLDYRLQIVLVINPEGKIIRTIGAQGDGPGETRTASRLLTYGSGEIGLVDMISSKITWLSNAGDPLSNQSLRFNNDGSGVVALYDARIHEGGYTAAFMRQNPDRNGTRFQIILAQLSENGIADNIISSAPEKIISRRGPLLNEIDAYNFVYNCWDVSKDGTVYVAMERDSNRIEVFSDNGEKQTALTIEGVRPQRTNAEKKQIIETYNARDRNFIAADWDPFFSHIWCDESDRVWACTPIRNNADNTKVYRQYDIFSSTGKLEYRLEIQLPSGMQNASSSDSWYLIDSSLVVIVENFEEGISTDGNSDCRLTEEGGFVIRCYELRHEQQ